MTRTITLKKTFTVFQTPFTNEFEKKSSVVSKQSPELV